MFKRKYTKNVLVTHSDLHGEEVCAPAKSLQKQPTPTAHQIPLTQDRYSVSQNLSLLHVMSTEGEIGLHYNCLAYNIVLERSKVSSDFNLAYCLIPRRKLG